MNKEQLLSKKEQLLSKKEQIEKIAKIVLIAGIFLYPFLCSFFCSFFGSAFVVFAVCYYYNSASNVLFRSKTLCRKIYSVSYRCALASYKRRINCVKEHIGRDIIARNGKHIKSITCKDNNSYFIVIHSVDCGRN